jgi:hypothetical protein|tara:strand:+ start:67 stop:951 length:885 start_codon:yes stop_codon:yes gene_type:complete
LAWKKKKKGPFNPFAPNASKTPTKQQSGTRREAKPVSYKKAPTPQSKPAEIEPSAPKPAIPTSHLPPTEESVIEPKVESPEPEIQDDEKDIETTSESVAESGPATAAGKVRSVGLRKIDDDSDDEVNEEEGSDDDRITERDALIAESKALAADSGLIVEGKEDEIIISTLHKKTTEQEIKEVKKTVSEKAFEKRKQQLAKKRKIRAAAPPTKRVQKLNRRKYMEFKVDIREILEEENVLEEHRANLLGSTWAKGERQGIQGAIEFVEEKEADGIISDVVAERIIKVLKGYRKVR